MSLLSILALTSIAAVILAGIVLFVEYPRSAVDRTRNDLFTLRDELFQLAHAGRIRFDHPGYRAARDLLNGMIRYAHDVSATHLIFANVFANRESKQLSKAIGRAIKRDLESLPRGVSGDVNSILGRASNSMVRLVIFRSAGLSLVFAGYAALHAVVACLRLAVEAIAETASASRKKIAVTEVPHASQKQNLDDSMQDVLEHYPMRRVPRLVVREAATYARRLEPTMLPQAA